MDPEKRKESMLSREKSKSSLKTLPTFLDEGVEDPMRPQTDYLEETKDH